MGPLGFPELIIIFLVALVVFGPRKLPELGQSLGRGLSEFKRASNDLRHTLDDEIRDEERRTRAAQTRSPAPPDRGSEPEHRILPPADEPPAVPERPADTVARGEPAEARPPAEASPEDAR